MKIKTLLIVIISLLVLELLAGGIYFFVKNRQLANEKKIEEIRFNSIIGQLKSSTSSSETSMTNMTQAEKDAIIIRQNKERADKLAKEYEDFRVSHGMSSSTPVLSREEEIKKNEAEINNILKTFR